jgi:hypothetical protein
MERIELMQTGGGKTVNLAKLIEQDIKRSHRPIYFDGQGTKNLVESIRVLGHVEGPNSRVSFTESADKQGEEQK